MSLYRRPINAINHRIPTLRFISFQKDNGELCTVYHRWKNVTKFYIPDIQLNTLYFERNYPTNYALVILEYNSPVNCFDDQYKMVEIRGNSYDEIDNCTYFITNSITYNTNDTYIIDNAIQITL